MQELDWEQSEMRLLELVRTGDLSIGNQVQSCDGRWTWKSGVRKSIIDYMLFGGNRSS